MLRTAEGLEAEEFNLGSLRHRLRCRVLLSKAIGTKLRLSLLDGRPFSFLLLIQLRLELPKANQALHIAFRICGVLLIVSPPIYSGMRPEGRSHTETKQS